ncbi:FERM domain-containing protein 4B [Aphelenchoides fujianensis]|nr:FERM domain-containing protein 4B [Aphelenchoides fujianensis]
MSTATEGRTCRIHLLNGESVDLVLNKNHSVGELFAFANRQCGLPEASWKWFSLAFINQELLSRAPARPVPDALTLIHIFYDVRMQFLKGYLLLDYADFLVCCSALILLCNGGLLLDAEEVAEVFNEQIRPPVQLLRRFDAPLDEIHARVSETIKRLQPLTQGQLIIEFLKHAECSLTIGSAFYGVYDASSGHPLVLAINSRCLVLFEPSNVYQPKKIFRFQHVDSIQWKEKTFSVHLRQRSSLNHDE